MAGWHDFDGLFGFAAGRSLGALGEPFEAHPGPRVAGAARGHQGGEDVKREHERRWDFWRKTHGNSIGQICKP